MSERVYYTRSHSAPGATPKSKTTPVATRGDGASPGTPPDSPRGMEIPVPSVAIPKAGPAAVTTTRMDDRPDTLHGSERIPENATGSADPAADRPSAYREGEGDDTRTLKVVPRTRFENFGAKSPLPIPPPRGPTPTGLPKGSYPTISGRASPATPMQAPKSDGSENSRQELSIQLAAMTEARDSINEDYAESLRAAQALRNEITRLRAEAEYRERERANFEQSVTRELNAEVERLKQRMEEEFDERMSRFVRRLPSTCENEASHRDPERDQEPNDRTNQRARDHRSFPTSRPDTMDYDVDVPIRIRTRDDDLSLANHDEGSDSRRLSEGRKPPKDRIKFLTDKRVRNMFKTVFNGHEREDVCMWLNRVEEATPSELWADEGRTRFARTLLNDVAYLWISEESGSNSWDWKTLREKITQRFAPKEDEVLLREKL